MTDDECNRFEGNPMTGHSPRIRPATLDDLTVLQALGRDSYRDHFASLWTEQGLATFLDRDFSTAALQRSLDRPEHHRWLIAADDAGAAIGFAKLNWSSLQPLSGKPGAELQKLYLRGCATGQGWGEALMRAAVQQVHVRGESSLWLEVLQTNHRAQRFYQRQGFQMVGDIFFSSDIQAIGMRVMECRLECRYARPSIDSAPAQGDHAHAPSD
jgi:diamine N-acetyltransferase